MVTQTKIVIGSRRSKLALWQTNWVKHQLEKHHPALSISIKEIQTQGDKILDKDLNLIGDKGLFTREIEKELLNGTIDLATHSLKDLPTQLPDGLIIGVVPERANPQDVLISKDNKKLYDLPQNAVIATGSLRRKAQLLSYNSDYQVVGIRGNVPTRVKKFQENNYDGLILARAGLERLGLTNFISEVLPFEVMIPAVSQGALGIEICENRQDLLGLLECLHHSSTHIAVTAEREFLRVLEGGCHTPIGAYAKVSNRTLELTGFVGSLDGQDVVRGKLSGHIDNACETAKQLADQLLQQGGEDILKFHV